MGMPKCLQRMNSFRVFALAAALGLPLLAGVAPMAQAGIATGTFTVTATVQTTCSVTSSTGINFGNIQSPVRQDIRGQGTVSTTCTDGADYVMSLSVGSGAGATFDRRKMTSRTNVANTMDYSLYTDPNLTRVWGDGTGNTYTMHTFGGMVNVIWTVFGRIFGDQSPSAGDYADVVTVTLTF